MQQINFIVLVFSINAIIAADLDVDSLASNRLQEAKPVRIEEAPYQVSLQSLGVHVCGGSIISRNHVLTAGRCVYDETPSTLTIRAGTNVRQVGGSVHRVLYVYLHPDFRILENGYVRDDIAVVHVTSAFKFDETRQPLSTSHVAPAHGKLVRITGWGEVQEGSRTGLLHAFTVPVLDNSFCAEAFNLTNELMSRKECTGFLISENNYTCHLDVGAPLFWNTSYYPPRIIGIVSRRFGESSCDQEPNLQISTSPPYYHEWIQSIIF